MVGLRVDGDEEAEIGGFFEEEMHLGVAAHEVEEESQEVRVKIPLRGWKKKQQGGIFKITTGKLHTHPDPHPRKGCIQMLLFTHAHAHTFKCTFRSRVD